MCCICMSQFASWLRKKSFIRNHNLHSHEKQQWHHLWCETMSSSSSGSNAIMWPSSYTSSSSLNVLRIKSKTLILYSYSISNNFLKEILSKLGVNCILTKNIQKASLIIGLKKDLQKNFKLKELAKRKKIPVYSFQQISMYQLIKLIDKFIWSSFFLIPLFIP